MWSSVDGCKIYTVPSDVLQHHIFNFLSFPSLIACLFVSTRFRTVISKILDVQKPKLIEVTGIFRNYHERILEMLFEGGSLGLISWFRTYLRYPAFSPNDNHLNRCLNLAAKGGHLSILKYALEIGFDFSNSLNICFNAAKGGQLHVLQWARANGCPWNIYICSQAAKGGHLHVLQWARANGCAWNKTDCFWNARMENFQQLMDWIEQQPE